MRIVMLSREYPPETGWGGIGTYVYYMAHALADGGHDVHVISRSERPAVEYHRMDGRVHLHRVRERKWRAPWTDFFYGLLPISDWYYSRRMMEKAWELHAEKPIDIIEAPEYRAEAYHLVRKPPAPVAVKMHTPTFLLEQLNHTPRSCRQEFFKRMERSAAQRAHALCSPSRSLAGIVAKEWRLNGQHIEVVPYSIDTARLPQQAWSAGDPVALYIGRFENRKGVHVLVEAIPKVLAKVPVARFVFVGGHAETAGETAGYTDRLMSRLQELGCRDRVEFVGWKKSSELPDYYRRSTAVVVPSLYDNFPNVVLEGMASGRPVVGTAVGGIPEIITDPATGWLVPPGEVEPLAEALIEVLGDPAKAARVGAAARAWIQRRFSPQRIVEEAVVFYAKAIADSRGVRQGTGK